MGTNLFQNHLFEQLLAQPEKQARFLATRGGIPQLPPDIWHKIMPISTMTVMRNVSRGLRDVVDAMAMALRRPIAIVKSVIRGRDVRRMMDNFPRDILQQGGAPTGAAVGDRMYLTTEYLQADYRVDDPDLRPQALLRTPRVQHYGWDSTYDPRLSVGQFLNQFYNGTLGNHRRRRLP
jgi:hypothetical protein